MNLTKWVTNYTKIGAGGWLCWCLTTTDAPSEVALPGQPPLLCCWHLLFAVGIAFSWMILTVDLVRVDFERVDLERWPPVYIACLEFCTLCTLLTDLLSRSACPSSQCSRGKTRRQVIDSDYHRTYLESILKIYTHCIPVLLSHLMLEEPLGPHFINWCI